MNFKKPFLASVAAVSAMLLLVGCGSEKTATKADEQGQEVAASAAEKSSKYPEITKGPGPAIWRTGDDDTTIYLFGTVHVLPPELEWRNDVFNSIFKQADTVYFEADVDELDPQLGVIVAKLGFMPTGETLFDLLDEQQSKDLREALVQLNIAEAAVAKLRPWFASVMISNQFIVSSGQDPESGVEKRLIPEAKLNGKFLRYFETAEEQLGFLAGLDDQVQIDMLIEGVRQIEEMPDLLKLMDEAWVNGDVDTLAEIIGSDQSLASEIVQEAILISRNRNWADELAVLTEEEEGVFFVAVGAAHLAGDASVVDLMRGKGYTAVRIQ